MKALESSGCLDDDGHLQLDTPLQISNKRVKVIVLILGEEISDDSWVQALRGNTAFDFLYDLDEDIYSLTDGQPLTDEV